MECGVVGDTFALVPLRSKKSSSLLRTRQLKTENPAKPLIDMCFALDILLKQFDIFCNAKCDIFAKANKKGGKRAKRLKPE